MIDITNWKEFKIGDLFNTALSKDDIQPKNIEEGNIPLVSSGKNNNGIIASIRNDTAKIWDAGTITVDMFGKTFYQPNPYHCVSHGRVNILISRNPISENIGMFLCSVIESITNKYQFSEMCTGDKLSKDTIKLPSTPTGEPDWEYMEEYMKNIIEESEESIENLRKANSYKHLVNTSKWKEFKMSDIGFSNYHGIRQTKANREDGEIPLLTAGKENQGVASYIGNPQLTCEDAITVDMFGNSFYHKGIYAGDDNIYFFVNDTLSDNVKLFIASILNADNTEKYAFKEQFRQSQADSLKVKLPTTPIGEPDWKYMEEYMKNIENESDEILNQLYF